MLIFLFEGIMANDNSEDLKNGKKSAPSANSEGMDIDELIQENGKWAIERKLKNIWKFAKHFK